VNHFFYILFLSAVAFSANAQSVFKRKFEPKQILLFDVTVKQQFPGADMAKRFGKDASLGMDVSYKSPNNWVFGVGGHFMFGNTVNETGILDSLKGSTGEIIDENGQFAVVGFDQRGMFFGATVGKIITFGSLNKNSGLYISLGGGYLQHKIRIYSTNTVPQLTDEYKKGYDRLTAGPAATQYIGYRFLDPKKRLNFSLGFEFTEGFTQNQRSYNFDTRMQDTEKRLDLLYSLKLALTVPIYLKKANEEEFFE
jgi:hypothetical protein